MILSGSYTDILWITKNNTRSVTRTQTPKFPLIIHWERDLIESRFYSSVCSSLYMWLSLWAHLFSYDVDKRKVNKIRFICHESYVSRMNVCWVWVFAVLRESWPPDTEGPTMSVSGITQVFKSVQRLFLVYFSRLGARLCGRSRQTVSVPGRGFITGTFLLVHKTSRSEVTNFKGVNF